MCSRMARRKLREQREARRLRKLGWSLRAIASELEVSLGSASIWVRDIRVPQASKAVNGAAQTESDSRTAIGKKRCGRCRQVLALTSFNRLGDGHQGWCRRCFSDYFRERGTLYRRQCVSGKRERRRKARLLVQEILKSNRCADCGERDMAVLEFDHVRGKRKGICQLMGEGLDVKELKKEVERCEVVCVNCHRRRTATRANWRRSDPAWRARPGPLLRGEARNVDYMYGVLEASGCADCGTTDLCVLEFDHVGKKRGNVSKLAQDGVSLATLKAEIAVCVVRCANCHRRRTRQQTRETA